MWPEFDHSTKFGPSSTKIEQNWPEVDQSLSGKGIWLGIDQICPELDQIRKHSLESAKFAPKSANSDQVSTTSGPLGHNDLGTLGEQRSAPIVANSASLGMVVGGPRFSLVSQPQCASRSITCVSVLSFAAKNWSGLMRAPVPRIWRTSSGRPFGQGSPPWQFGAWWASTWLFSLSLRGFSPPASKRCQCRRSAWRQATGDRWCVVMITMDNLWIVAERV